MKHECELSEIIRKPVTLTYSVKLLFCLCFINETIIKGDAQVLLVLFLSFFPFFAILVLRIKRHWRDQLNIGLSFN